ncbi:unnamed protein product, partial [Closterium sp. NIES-54]
PPALVPPAPPAPAPPAPGSTAPAPPAPAPPMQVPPTPAPQAPAPPVPVPPARAPPAPAPPAPVPPAPAPPAPAPPVPVPPTPVPPAPAAPCSVGSPAPAPPTPPVSAAPIPLVRALSGLAAAIPPVQLAPIVIPAPPAPVSPVALINLQPLVSLPETTPTLRWTGKVGDASAFHVWGSRAFVHDTSVDKLSSHAVPYVFLGFPPDAPGWQFYHPTSRRVLSSQDVTFDESGPAPSGVSQVDPAEPVEVAVDSGAARGAEPTGAGTGGAEPGGAEPAGAGTGGAEPGGAEPERVEPGGAEPGGTASWGAEPARAEFGGSPGVPLQREPLAPQRLREWYARSCRRATSSAGAGATGGVAGAGAAGGAASAGATGGASGAGGSAGTGATGGAAGAGAAGGAAGAGAAGGAAGAGAAGGTAGAGAASVGTAGTGAGGVAGVVIRDLGAEGGALWGAESGRAERVEPRGAASGGAASGGAASGGAASGGAKPACAEPRGVDSGGESPEGSETAVTRSPWSSRLCLRVPLTSQQLHDWYGRRQHRTSAPQGSTAGGSSTGVAGPGGARTGGSEAAGAGGTGAAEGTGAAGGVGAAGGAGATGGTGAAGAGGTAQPRLFFTPPSPSSQPPPDSALRQVLSLPSSTGLPLPPGSLLPAPSPYTEQTGGLAERREPASRLVSPVRFGRRVPRPSQPAVSGPHLVVRHPSSPPSRVPLPPPPASSLPVVADPVSDQFRPEHSTATRLLATVVSDPSFESAAASALVAELVDFAAHCRLDYAASLVAESESVCPPSVGGECALGTDVLEDRQEDLECLAAAAPHLVSMLLAPEGDPDAPDIPTPRSYTEAIAGEYFSQWQTAMDAEMASWKSTSTYVDEVPPPGANIVNGMWIFKVKRPPGTPPVFKARYVARGFNQREGVGFFQTFSPTPKMTTLRVLLHIAAQRDYELHSLDFSTAFLQGSLHKEIWLRRPPGFTGSFPPGTQWSLRRPSLFLRTDTSLPPFYILVYIDGLVFATADTEALALVKSELQKRHTCTDLGELHSYLGLQITRDRARRTITLTQSHMVQQVLQRFAFTWSSAHATPLATGHSLSAPPSDESVESSGPYPELVGCLMYKMTCTRPDLAYPLGLLAHHVAPGRHRKVQMDAAKRVLRYLCSTSGMGLVLGGWGNVVLTGHSDASWVEDQATQRSSQGYTFSLGSGSVSWRST